MDRASTAERIVASLSKGVLEPHITVVGCGGAGNNIVQRIYSDCKSNVETVAVNTDERRLAEIGANKKVLIGKDVTMGQGADGFPEVGAYCADCARSTFRSVLDGSDIVIIVAGMGGGTGTGVAPVIAEVSRELDAVTFAIAINPFSFETERTQKAKEGIAKLRQATSSTIVLENDRLIDLAGDVPIGDSMAIMDRSVIKIIDSLCMQISESFITQIQPEVEEMVQTFEEVESPSLSSPEPSVLQASAEGVEARTSSDIGNTLLMQ
jgi:cell division protein FtsZ